MRGKKYMRNSRAKADAVILSGKPRWQLQYGGPEDLNENHYSGGRRGKERRGEVEFWRRHKPKKRRTIYTSCPRGLKRGKKKNRFGRDSQRRGIGRKKRKEERVHDCVSCLGRRSGECTHKQC